MRLSVFSGCRRERVTLLFVAVGELHEEFVLESAQANEEFIHENMGLLEKAEDRNLNCKY